MKTHRINVTDEPDVIFKGREIACVNDDSMGLHYRITLYQTEALIYIVVREHVMHGGRIGRTACAYSTTLSNFKTFLGNDAAAKAFYKKMGIFNAKRIA